MALAAQDKNQMSTLLCIDAHIGDHRPAVVVDALGITDGIF